MNIRVNTGRLFCKDALHLHVEKMMYNIINLHLKETPIDLLQYFYLQLLGLAPLTIFGEYL